MSGLFSGLARGIHSGIGLADAFRRRDAAKRDDALRSDLGAIWDNPDDPSAKFREGAEVALKHGRPQVAASLSNAAGAAQEQARSEMSFRQHNAAQVLFPQLTGTPDDFEILSRVNESNPQLIADLLQMPGWRSVRQFALRTNDKGEPRMTAIIDNGRTGTTGVATVNASADPADRALEIDPRRIKAAVGMILAQRGKTMKSGSAAKPVLRYERQKDGTIFDKVTGRVVKPGQVDKADWIEALIPKSQGVLMGQETTVPRAIVSDIWDEAERRGHDPTEVTARASAMLNSNIEEAEAIRDADTYREREGAIRRFRNLVFGGAGTKTVSSGRNMENAKGGKRGDRPPMPSGTKRERKPDAADPKETAAEAKPFLGHVQSNPDRGRGLSRMWDYLRRQ